MKNDGFGREFLYVLVAVTYRTLLHILGSLRGKSAIWNLPLPIQRTFGPHLFMAFTPQITPCTNFPWKVISLIYTKRVLGTNYGNNLESTTTRGHWISLRGDVSLK